MIGVLEFPCLITQVADQRHGKQATFRQVLCELVELVVAAKAILDAQDEDQRPDASVGIAGLRVGLQVGLRFMTFRWVFRG